MEPRISKKLTIIIPIKRYAEELEAGLKYFLNSNQANQIPCQIIIVDDGSQEASEIQEIAKSYQCSYLRLDKNRGKGAAIQAGINITQTKFVIFTDSDFPYHFVDIESIYNSLSQHSIAIGDRTLDRQGTHQFSSLRRFASWLFNRFSAMVLNLEKVDNQCGIKGFHTDIAKKLFHNLTTNRYAFDAEILYRAKFLGLKTHKIPVSLRVDGKSSLALYQDAPRMLYDLFRIRFFSKRAYQAQE